MRALRLTGWKQPPELLEVEDPDPGPGEVVIRVGGAGACHSDLHLMEEFEEGSVLFEPPFTLGHETAGWVERLGAGVIGFEVGDPVAVYGPWGCGLCHRCRAGMENYCERQAEIGTAGGGLGSDGGMAPFMLVPAARLLVPLGELDPVEAAPLTDAGLTPYHAVKRSLHKLIPGSHAVVVGAGGGLGHMAVQILRAISPATVIAVDRNPEALELAMDHGAHHGVMSDRSAADEVRRVTGDHGAELVLDLVGIDPTIELAAGVVRPLGDLTLIGIGGGSYPFSFFSVPYEVCLATTYWGSITELMEVMALAERGLIRAEVERFSLDEGNRAYERMKAGELRGRAVIVPDGPA